MEIIRLLEREKYHCSDDKKTMWGGICNCNDFPDSTDEKILDNYFSYKYGTFCLIYEDDEYIVAAADIIGSKPLFYCKSSDHKLFVSDDAFLIAKVIHKRIDRKALNEYYNAGFVSYARTLFDGIMQVMPGEYCIVNKKTGNIKTHQYYTLDYDESNHGSIEKLEAEFYKVLKNVMRDLIERLNGREAVLPLSGGFDSRTIAVMLKECGYKNVTCFSYGKRENPEALISRRVAKTLGFKWLFVEYSGEKWRQLLKADSYKRFLYHSGRGRSAGCIQGLPAILELKEKRLLSEDAVIIPGHTLDVLAGSHLHLITEKFPISKKKYLDNLEYMHYSNGKGLKLKNKEGRISEPLPEKISKTDYLRLNQKFEYYNRQNKFVANDIRTYESAGYDVEIPLWDIRVCDYWSRIPVELLKDRRLQNLFTIDYINPKCRIMEEYPEVKDAAALSPNKSVRSRIKDKVQSIPYVGKWGYILYLAITEKYSSVGDWAAFWDMTKREYLKHCIKYGQMTVNGRAAGDYISLIENDLKD